MEYIIRHEYRDIHNALLQIYVEILKDKYEYFIKNTKEVQIKITDLSMRMTTDKEFDVGFKINKKQDGNTYEQNVNCELIQKEHGLGEFAIFSLSEEEGELIINIFKFLNKRFYKAQLNRELLGE
jgi:hypothetical protein|nr:MAG TPA: hypothetical protein [Caudoviricetes sp.]